MLIYMSAEKHPYVPLAQPDRVFGYEPKGRGFESLMARQKKQVDTNVSACLFCFYLFLKNIFPFGRFYGTMAIDNFV